MLTFQNLKFMTFKLDITQSIIFQIPNVLILEAKYQLLKIGADLRNAIEGFNYRKFIKDNLSWFSDSFWQSKFSKTMNFEGWIMLFV